MQGGQWAVSTFDKQKSPLGNPLRAKSAVDGETSHSLKDCDRIIAPGRVPSGDVEDSYSPTSTRSEIFHQTPGVGRRSLSVRDSVIKMASTSSSPGPGCSGEDGTKGQTLNGRSYFSGYYDPLDVSSGSTSTSSEFNQPDPCFVVEYYQEAENGICKGSLVHISCQCSYKPGNLATDLVWVDDDPSKGLDLGRLDLQDSATVLYPHPNNGRYARLVPCEALLETLKNKMGEALCSGGGLVAIQDAPNPRLGSLAIQLTQKGTAVLPGWTLGCSNTNGTLPPGARLEGVHIVWGNFENADLNGVDFSGVHLDGAWLKGTHLSKAQLVGTHLQDANLEGSNMADANLQGANLSGAYMSGARLHSANFEGCDLGRVDMHDADLSKANLVHATLSMANLKDANLMYASMIEANLQGTNLAGSNMKFANLQGAHVAGAVMDSINLDGANLCQCDLKGSVLNNASLKGSKLKGAHLDSASLRNARMQEADLCGAELCGTILDNANLEHICWHQAKTDSATSVAGARFKQLLFPTKRPHPPHAATFWQALVGRQSVRKYKKHINQEEDVADCELEGPAVPSNDEECQDSQGRPQLEVWIRDAIGRGHDTLPCHVKRALVKIGAMLWDAVSIVARNEKVASRTKQGMQIPDCERNHTQMSTKGKRLLQESMQRILQLMSDEMTAHALTRQPSSLATTESQPLDTAPIYTDSQLAAKRFRCTMLLLHNTVLIIDKMEQLPESIRESTKVIMKRATQEHGAEKMEQWIQQDTNYCKAWNHLSWFARTKETIRRLTLLDVQDMNKHLHELQHLLHCLTTLRRPVTAESWQEIVEEWVELLGLLSKLQSVSVRNLSWKQYSWTNKLSTL